MRGLSRVGNVTQCNLCEMCYLEPGREISCIIEDGNMNSMQYVEYQIWCLETGRRGVSLITRDRREYCPRDLGYNDRCKLYLTRATAIVGLY